MTERALVIGADGLLGSHLVRELLARGRRVRVFQQRGSSSPTMTGLDLERVRLDRMVDEDGNQIRDVSHDGARTFTRAEIETILGTDF